MAFDVHRVKKNAIWNQLRKYLTWGFDLFMTGIELINHFSMGQHHKGGT